MTCGRETKRDIQTVLEAFWCLSWSHLLGGLPAGPFLCVFSGSRLFFRTVLSFYNAGLLDWGVWCNQLQLLWCRHKLTGTSRLTNDEGSCESTNQSYVLCGPKTCPTATIRTCFCLPSLPTPCFYLQCTDTLGKERLWAVTERSSTAALSPQGGPYEGSITSWQLITIVSM